MKPALSVLIDTYNHEKYIEQAVLSAIEQDFPAGDYEIVVVDDGSTDRTPEIVRKFGPRVRLLRKENGGQASAFNAAIPELQGEIVAFLDGDDWFAPGKLTAVMNALAEHPEAAAIGHGYYEYHDGSGSSEKRAPTAAFYADLATPDAARLAHSAWPFLIMGALTARRTALERLGPVAPVLRFCADSPIAVGLLASGAWIIPQPFCFYRHHGSNLYVDADAHDSKSRSRFEMMELMYRELDRLTLQLGVRKECAAALFYANWVDFSRRRLSTFGGSRLEALETEMRGFRSEHEAPSSRYRLFKYLVVGTAALLLPASRFYRARDWYGRRNLGRLRNLVCKASH